MIKRKHSQWTAMESREAARVRKSQVFFTFTVRCMDFHRWVLADRLHECPMLSNNLLLHMGGTLNIAGKISGSGRDCFVATLPAMTGDKYVITGNGIGGITQCVGKIVKT